MITPEGDVYRYEFKVIIGSTSEEDTVTGTYLLKGPLKYIPLTVIVLGIILLRRLKVRMDAKR